MNVPMEILIVVCVAAIVAIAIRVVRTRTASRSQAPPHIHDALMRRRAETYASESPFLKKVCREYKANGHISNRQADAAAKAIARIEAARSRR